MGGKLPSSELPFISFSPLVGVKTSAVGVASGTRQDFLGACNTISDRSKTEAERATSCGIVIGILHEDYSNQTKIIFPEDCEKLLYSLASALSTMGDFEKSKSFASEIIRASDALKETKLRLFGSGMSEQYGGRQEFCSALVKAMRAGYDSFDGSWSLSDQLAAFISQNGENVPETFKNFMADAIHSLSQMPFILAGRNSDSVLDCVSACTYYAADKFDAGLVEDSLDIVRNSNFSRSSLSTLNWMCQKLRGNQAFLDGVDKDFFSIVCDKASSQSFLMDWSAQEFSNFSSLFKWHVDDTEVRKFINAYNDGLGDSAAGCATNLCFINPELLDMQEFSSFVGVGRQTAERLISNSKEWFFSQTNDQTRGAADFKAIFILANKYGENFIDSLSRPPFNLSYLGDYPEEFLKSTHDFAISGQKTTKQLLLMAFTRTPRGVEFGRFLSNSLKDDPGILDKVQPVIFSPGTDSNFGDATSGFCLNSGTTATPLLITSMHGASDRGRIGKSMPKTTEFSDYIDVSDRSIFQHMADSWKTLKGQPEWIINACSTAEGGLNGVNLASVVSTYGSMVYANTFASTGLISFTLIMKQDGTYGFGEVNMYSVIKIDGRTQTGIDSKNEENFEISAYPNPTSGIVNFSLPQGKNVEINIFDNLGRKIGQLPLQGENGSAIADLSSFPNGVYLYQIFSSGGGGETLLKNGSILKIQ